MYVCKEDIFSAIYYQLKLFFKSNGNICVKYHSKKAVLEQEIAEFWEILSDPMESTRMLYEQLVCEWIDKNTYLAEKAKFNEDKERLECVEQRLDTHEWQYQQFMKLQRVLDKELPLDEVMDCIDRIVVSEGRHIEVARNSSYVSMNNRNNKKQQEVKISVEKLIYERRKVEPHMVL